MNTSRLAFELYSVSARLLRLLGSRQRTGALTHQRVSTLLALAENGTSSVKELAQRESVAHSTMSRLVSALGAAGFVTMSDGKGRSGDRRTRAVRLTEKGKRTAERELRQMIALLEQRIATLTDTDLSSLRRAIGILRNIASSVSDIPLS